MKCFLCKRVISDFKSELIQGEIHFGISLSNTTLAQSKCCSVKNDIGIFKPETDM